MSVKQTLGSKYPWSPFRCEEEDCLQCCTTKKNKISCRTPGVGYIITCTVCEAAGRRSEYHGETGQTVYERGKKHVSEFIAGLPSNFSVIHNKVHHGGSNQMNFRMEAVKKFISPLDRQIDESLRIHYTEVDRKEGSDVVVMNSMSEWRNNKIPRATFADQETVASSSLLHPHGETNRRRQRGRGRTPGDVSV